MRFEEYRRGQPLNIEERELCTYTDPGQAHPGPRIGAYAPLAWPGRHIHRSWAQDGPGQDRCRCIVGILLDGKNPNADEFDWIEEPTAPAPAAGMGQKTEELSNSDTKLLYP